MAKLTSKYNFKVLYPKLAKQWHPKRNDLTPKEIRPQSRYKAWWVCKQGHEWQAVVFSRSYGSGCPYCTRQRPTKKYNLRAINPKLAKAWHPVKNGNLTPRDVTPGSNKKVWWKCKKGHEWDALIRSRNRGSGCPYCTGKKVCIDNCLQTRNPNLAKEWHPTKNGKLTPRDVTSSGRSIVWWQCSAGHAWQATVNSRNHGTGCKQCRGWIS